MMMRSKQRKPEKLTKKEFARDQKVVRQRLKVYAIVASVVLGGLVGVPSAIEWKNRMDAQEKLEQDLAEADRAVRTKLREEQFARQKAECESYYKDCAGAKMTHLECDAALTLVNCLWIKKQK